MANSCSISQQANRKRKRARQSVGVKRQSGTLPLCAATSHLRVASNHNVRLYAHSGWSTTKPNASKTQRTDSNGQCKPHHTRRLTPDGWRVLDRRPRFVSVISEYKHQSAHTDARSTIKHSVKLHSDRYRCAKSRWHLSRRSAFRICGAATHRRPTTSCPEHDTQQESKTTVPRVRRQARQTRREMAAVGDTASQQTRRENRTFFVNYCPIGRFS